jgi:hypothetical protein
MANRKKALKQRLYTYERLNSRLFKYVRSGTGEYQLYLYGKVAIGYAAGGRMLHGIDISYRGKHGNIRIATVYRLLDGDTMYAVHGIGKRQNKSKLVRHQIDLWQRYAPAFTPQTTRLYGGEGRHYLLRAGSVSVTPLEEPHGAWLTMPSAMCPKPNDWTGGVGFNKGKFKSLQNFPRRCKLFATRLRLSLAEDKQGEVQLRNWHDWGHGRTPEGNTLHVCTPPSTRRNGRQLVVHIAMHDAESRKFHHIDGDWGIKHCQFFALERGKDRSDMMRWKCAKDAINGIKEWIIGDIYIPGPG